ncbi:hypothetical protein [Falsibacillus albus]|uniref:Uncharacterized protein n=1 Tax=Falsibacillus albus TaxID=2478915 RepID=A0A3L7K508_9BACI|nr:hypothetical protein [Falsibacillus albus]RLQ97359.1 hypothetical protein D9X91_04200 [Falsibacillus albus]
MKVYDHSFNANEWFTCGVFFAAYAFLFILPRRFSKQDKALYVILGMFIGNFYDHTISVPPWNFYDVNDTSEFQLMDFISYFMYGPFSYYFVYIWDALKITDKHIPLYIFIWSIISMVMEFIAHQLGVYHYRQGYEIYYSFAVYPLMQFTVFLLFNRIQKENNMQKGQI